MARVASDAGIRHVGLTGDAYETGSILLTWLPPFSGDLHERLVGDDVFRIAAQVEGPLQWIGLGIAFAVGAALCFLWYEVMSGVVGTLGRTSASAQKEVVAR